MFTFTCRLVGDGLFGKIHFHFHLRVCFYRIEQFLQKLLGYNHRKHKVVQLIILMNIGKKAGYHHTETIAGNCPGCVFTAGTRTEVLTCHQYLSAVSRVVQHKILVQGTICIVTPVTKKVITEEFFFTSGCFQETCRNNLVSIYVFQRKRYTSTCDYIKFCLSHLFIYDLTIYYLRLKLHQFSRIGNHTCHRSSSSHQRTS